jgi:FkbM family methyltransferase
MSSLKQFTRTLISRLPKSQTLAACCRCYWDRCNEDPTPGEASGDMENNGELRLLRELAPQLRTVMDVGAHVGDWTSRLLSCAPDAQVHAFEPSAQAWESLQIRRFPQNVMLHRMALSSTAGVGSLKVFADAPSWNTLHNRHGLEAGWGRAPATTSEDVRLDTLDAFCAEHSLDSVDLLKIDTEGHEVDVLLGSQTSLAAGIIRRVQFEYGGAYLDSRRQLRDAFELFSGLDYLLFRIVPDGLAACPVYDRRLENFRYNNYLALRRDAVAGTPSAGRALEHLRS